MTGQEIGRNGFQFDNVSVEKIRIRSKAWDRLKAAEKAELLNQTFRVLHSQFQISDVPSCWSSTIAVQSSGFGIPTQSGVSAHENPKAVGRAFTAPEGL